MEKEEKAKEINVGEEQFFKCKICNEVKKRILAGMYDAKNKRWVDENGRDHSGRVCSSCHSSRVKYSMKRLRHKRKASDATQGQEPVES